MLDRMSGDTPSNRSTRHFAPDTAAGWPFVVAALERMGPWAVRALRLGILSLLSEHIRLMAQPGAKRDTYQRAVDILGALGHLPWDG